MAESGNAIEAHGLEKCYRGGTRALGGISFTVRKGSVFALLGPNGAGKSTTVRILATLARPDAGSAEVAGHDVLRAPDRVRRSIGYISQKSAVDLEATAAENLRLQGQLHGLRGPAVRLRTEDLLGRFGLQDAARRVTRTYSGGMLRRLDVAMGLVHRPAVLFLDEPTTGLDPESRQEMWQEIRRLGQDEGLTVLLTTHYLEEADALAERIAIVDRGRIVASGTPDELKSELHGDTIRVELKVPVAEDRVRRALEGVPTLRDLRLDGRTLRLRVARGEQAMPPVLAALDGAGVAVAAATLARPSLDDVYLHHTGRTYASAEEES